jgi:hypothetical protein
MLRLGLRHPSAALIVSTIALIVALGGTSYAAFSLPKNSVGTKQLKNGAVTTNKIAKSVQVSDALRAYHANSADTATSANQATSAVSATIATTAGHASSADTATTAGSAGTLASGKSLTGVYMVGSQGPVPGSSANGSITFAFPLASAPTGHIIRNGAASTAQCPGTVSNPQAAPGNFCLYEGLSATNIGSLGIGDPIADKGGAVSPHGLNVNIVSVAAGYFADQGSWAVTAP